MKTTEWRSGRRYGLLLAAVVLIFRVSGGSEEKAFKGFVSGRVNLFSSSDSVYREIYGGALQPEVKLGVGVWKNLYVWGGFGWLSDKGSLPSVLEETRVKRTEIGVGAGWRHELEKWSLRGEVGLVSISYKEEALGETGKGSGLGCKVTGAADYCFWKRLYFTLQASWFDARTDSEAEKLKLGGLIFGAGIGVRM
jgi:hypothetical protein